MGRIDRGAGLDPPAGLRLGRVEVVEEAGEGATSRVYRGRLQPDLHPVALKVLESEDGHPRALVARMIHELHAVAALDHPAVARLQDYGIVSESEARASRRRFVAGAPWLATDWVRGTPLSQAKAALDWGTLKAVSLDVLGALAQAHARGLVHRDVKPGNILMRADGRGCLVDFGLAVLADDVIPASERVEALGTPNYMAPEQVGGAWRWFGPWTDLYGLGCTLWAMVAGAGPFAHLSPPQAVLHAHIHTEPGPLLPVVRVPEAFEGWLRRLLHKDPLARPRFAADAAAELEAMGLSAPWSGATLGLGASVGDATLTEAGDPAGDLPATALGRTDPGRTARARGLQLHGVREPALRGRDADCRRLRAALTRTLDTGRCHVALIVGACGLGKTRLARWLAEGAHEEGLADVLFVRHREEPSAGDGLPAAIARYLRCVDLTGDALVRRLTQLEAQGEAVPPGKARLLAACLDPSGTPPSERIRSRTCLEVVGRLAGQRPLVLVVDDAQWGGATLDAVQQLVGLSRLAPLPVLVVVAAQTEALAESEAARAALATLAEHGSTRTLTLSPLHAADARALCEAMVGEPGPVALALAERSGGNPLFAVQLLSHWLQRDPVHAAVGRLDSPGELPDDLRALWSRRVDRLMEDLTEADRRALQAAAALGGDVQDEEWARSCAALGLSASPALVNRLAERGLARRVDTATWQFVHGMFRETLLTWGGPVSADATLHAACADTLKAGLSDDDEAPDQRRRLVRHLLAAGRTHEALPELERIVGYQMTHGGVHLAEPLVAAYAAAVQDVAFAGQPERIVSLLLQSALARASGARPKSIQWSATAVAQAEAQGHSTLEVRARVELAQAWTGLDALEALRHAEQARKQSRTVEPRVRAHAAAVVAQLVAEERPSRAERLMDEAIGLVTEAGAPRTALGYRLARVEQAGRAEASDRDLEELAGILAEARETQAVMLEARTLLIRGEAHRELGHLPEAEADYRASAAVTPPGGLIGLYARLNLSILRAKRGDFEEALIMAQQQLRVPECRNSGFLACVTWVACLPGLATGRDDAAFEEALRGATAYADGSFRNSADEILELLNLARQQARSAARPGRARALTALIVRIQGASTSGDFEVASEVSFTGRTPDA